MLAATLADAEMVYRVYSAWIRDFGGEQLDMLNRKFGFAPIMPPENKIKKLDNKIIKLSMPCNTVGGYTILFYNQL